MKAAAGGILVAGAVLAVLAGPAAADDFQGGYGGSVAAGCTDGGECTVGAGFRQPGSEGGGGGSPAGSGGAPAPQVSCRYYVDSPDAGSGDPADPATFTVGQMVWVQCFLASDGYTPYGQAYQIPWGTNATAVPVPRVEDLAQVAFGQMRIPLPAARMNPEGEQVVGLPAWLWVGNWVPVSRAASAATVWATVTATPLRQEWSFGADGGHVSCAGPGTPYDPTRPEAVQRSDCQYAFHRSSAGQPGDAFVVSATVVWRVTWTSSEPGRGGDLGTVTRTTTLAVPVGEIQALND